MTDEEGGDNTLCDDLQQKQKQKQNNDNGDDDDAVIDNDNGDDGKLDDKLESESESSLSSSSSLLFASLLVKRIVTFVKQKPCDFAITILPPNSSDDFQEDSNNKGGIIDEDADGDNTGLNTADNDNDDNNEKQLLFLLSKRQRSFLETSIVLIREDVADDDKLEEEAEEEADADADADDSDSETIDGRKLNYQYHLGIEARTVPLLARTLRDLYRTSKSKMNMMESSSSRNSDQKNRNTNTIDKDEEEEEENGTTNNNGAINRSSSSGSSNGRSSSNLTITTNEKEYRLLLDITSCVLLLQPDHSTVWADRRRCLLQLISFQRQQKEEQQHQQANQSSPISKNSNNTNINNNNNNNYNDNDNDNDNDNTTTSLSFWYTELAYVNLLMTQHSKAPSSWAHRKYVLRQIVQCLMMQQQQQQQNPTSSLPVVFLQLQDAVLSNLVMKEMDLCTRIAEQYPKNYYAWTHRIYVWKEIYLLHYYGSLKLMSTTTNPSLTATRTTTTAGVLLLRLLENELRTRIWQEWVPKHPTDHSAIHYSCYLLDHSLSVLVSTTTTDRSVITSEEEIARCAFQQVQMLLAKYPSSTAATTTSSHSNECIWILRRNTCQIIWKYSRTNNTSTSTSTSVNDTNDSAGSSPTTNTNTNTASRSSTNNTNNDEDRITTTSNRNNIMRRRMRQLVRDDIRSVIKNTLNIFTTTTAKREDVEPKEDDRNTKDKTTNIHAWTFVAWCLANLQDIDDDDDGDNDDDDDDDDDSDSNTSNENHDTTIIFTQLVREAILLRFSTTTTATKITSKRNSTYGRGYYKYVI